MTDPNHNLERLAWSVRLRGRLRRTCDRHAFVLLRALEPRGHETAKRTTERLPRAPTAELRQAVDR